MENWICVTCGSQFSQSQQAPAACPICLDQRQYVGPQGQQWTTLSALREHGFRAVFKDHEPQLVSIGTTPKFGIGQRALLVRGAQGNVR